MPVKFEILDQLKILTNEFRLKKEDETMSKTEKERLREK